MKLTLDGVLFSLLMVNVFMLLFYRLMIEHLTSEQSGRKKATGFQVVFSLPEREGLPPDAMPYYRRYWAAAACLLAFIVLGTLKRLYQ